MRTCSLFVSGPTIYALPMIETRASWVRFVGPAILIGDEDALSDEQLGQSVKAVMAIYKTGVPDEEETTEGLDRSVKQHGFKSYRTFFRQCLQMSVEETADGYEVTPYERVNSRETEGAVPTDTILSSTKAANDLGRVVREGITYSR
jgi:hypothetical protein